MTAGETALTLAHSGISVIPIVPGDKKASVEWKPYQERIASDDELVDWFATGNGIAAICGPISGGLEVIDFDIPGKMLGETTPPAYGPWKALLKEHGYEDLLRRLIAVKTPSGGIHIVYRCAAATDGNLKLAMRSKTEVLIETRGRGGYFLIPPSAGYTLLAGSFEAIPVVTEAEREILHVAARMLNEHWEKTRFEVNAPACKRPGDAYNLTGPSWEELLMRHGWKPVGKKGAWMNFTRPGKSEGVSAGYNEESGLFHVFSSSTSFELGRGYSKFSAYTVLEHGGDFTFAAKTLASQGFGDQRDRITSIPRPRAGVALVDDDLDDMPTPASRIKPEKPKWLWEPYIRIGHINLIEGWGGAMKSTLQLAIATQGSIGVEPMTGKPWEKFRTLYIARQDSKEEIRELLDTLGADSDYIDVYDGPMELDDMGMLRLAEWIEGRDYRMVCFDPMKNMFPRWIKAEFDNIGIGKFFDALRSVFMARDCAPVATRHFAAAFRGKRLEDAAAGGQEWRNSARTQLVGFQHPDKSRQAVYFPARGSMLAAAGEPFGIDMRRGEFMWAPLDCIDIEPYIEAFQPVAEFMGVEQKNKGGRPPSPERAKCEEWLNKEIEAQGFVYIKDGIQWAESVGISRDSLYNAVRSSGLKTDMTSDNRKIWTA